MSSVISSGLINKTFRVSIRRKINDPQGPSKGKEVNPTEYSVHDELLNSYNEKGMSVVRG